MRPQRVSDRGARGVQLEGKSWRELESLKGQRESRTIAKLEGEGERSDLILKGDGEDPNVQRTYSIATRTHKNKLRVRNGRRAGPRVRYASGLIRTRQGKSLILDANEVDMNGGSDRVRN